MAEKTILHGSFWYIDDEGRHLTAVRGDTVDITRDEDLKRGERHGAFATPEDLAEGSDFRAFVDRRAAAGAPGVVFVDPADVEARTSPAGSADPRIQSGMIDPATVPSRTGGGEAVVGEGRPSVNAPKDTWVEYHVEQRPDDVDEDTARAQAKAMTKDDLKRRAGVDYSGAAGDGGQGDGGSTGQGSPGAQG